MRTAIIITDDGIKQIVFTPENESEKQALDLLDPDHDIELLITSGSMYDGYERETFSAGPSVCKKGYIRFYKDKDSRILVLKPKNKE